MRFFKSMLYPDAQLCEDEETGTLWHIRGDKVIAGRAIQLALQQNAPRSTIQENDGRVGRCWRIATCWSCRAIGVAVQAFGDSGIDVPPEVCRRPVEAGEQSEIFVCRGCR